MTEHITFGRAVLKDGKLEIVEQRQIRKSDIRKCPFSVFVAEHYREDGSCKCDDAEHRKMMIAAWDYSPEDFAGIPLREEPQR